MKELLISGIKGTGYIGHLSFEEVSGYDFRSNIKEFVTSWFIGERYTSFSNFYNNENKNPYTSIYYDSNLAYIFDQCFNHSENFTALNDCQLSYVLTLAHFYHNEQVIQLVKNHPFYSEKLYLEAMQVVFIEYLFSFSVPLLGRYFKDGIPIADLSIIRHYFYMIEGFKEESIFDIVRGNLPPSLQQNIPLLFPASIYNNAEKFVDEFTELDISSYLNALYMAFYWGHDELFHMLSEMAPEIFTVIQPIDEGYQLPNLMEYMISSNSTQSDVLISRLYKENKFKLIYDTLQKFCEVEYYFDDGHPNDENYCNIVKSTLDETLMSLVIPHFKGRRYSS